jgi:peptide/nickel transport system substrate-binding protein
MSRKTVILCLLSLIILVSLTTSVLAEVKGPIVDKIYINAKMSEDIGLMDAAEGLTDIFFWGVSGPTIMGLDQATRDKLDIYSVPSGSRSLNFNPIPNAAPYIVKVEDKELFNPFAIREVRFAMNDLINRQYIVDEILGGAGGPQFAMATPGQPGTYKYGLIATRMGMTAEGNEKKALDEIAEALKKAASLPELQGRLVKQGDWWTFDGDPATIKFLIRVDCADRSKYGQYIANQIEKAGIKVERLLWDRSKCGTIVYGSDPADYKWNIYTEGWGAGATRAFWEHIVCQMYAPWYGYMAGGPDHEWRYENEELDKVTEKAYTGNFLTEEEYWEYALKGLELGLKDACRIYLTYQNDYFTANKEAFNKKMAYGLGDGLNGWSLITADTKSKELRMTQFSAKGALFMSAWDPIGKQGFTDVYSRNLADPMVDGAMFEHPASAIPTARRVVPEKVETEVSRDKETGDVVGDILVSPDAIKYDSAKKEWYKVGADVKAMSTGTYSFLWGNFHHGLPITTTNILYAGAFNEEWVNEDGEGDKYYDAALERALKPGLETDKGMVLNPDGTITTYFDYNFPPSKERTASWGAPWISVGWPGIIQPWEIYEALAELVAVGSESGTVYSFTPAEGVEQVDLLRPSCVNDIRAKLAEMLDKGHVPASIKDYVTVVLWNSVPLETQNIPSLQIIGLVYLLPLQYVLTV